MTIVDASAPAASTPRKAKSVFKHKKDREVKRLKRRMEKLQADVATKNDPPLAKKVIMKRKMSAGKKPAAAVDLNMMTISKEHISRLPVVSWQGPVQVLNTTSEMMNAVREILDSGEKNLGFDTETKPVFRRGDYNRPALIQLATSSKVYLFRICKLPNHVFMPLLPVLTDPTILKTGVAIHDDVKKLQQVLPFEAAGFVDCTEITVKHLRIVNTGLQALAAHFLQGRISKSQQMSNWAAESYLSYHQIQYAATDAWVSRQVYVQAIGAANACTTVVMTSTTKSSQQTAETEVDDDSDHD